MRLKPGGEGRSGLWRVRSSSSVGAHRPVGVNAMGRVSRSVISTWAFQGIERFHMRLNAGHARQIVAEGTAGRGKCKSRLFTS